MLFKCPNCQTQYDFDETQIPAEGVAVQCTNCPQIFEVQCPATQVIPVPDEWEIRQTNGNSFRFKELSTLQTWIIEQKVCRDDQISKGGSNWRRLGEIPELAQFFKVVENQQAQQQRMAAYPNPMAQQWGQGMGQMPVPMPPSYTPTNGDYMMVKPKKHYFLRTFIIVIAALGLGGGAFYVIAPESFDHSIAQPVKALLGMDKISPEAQAAFDQAQNKINLWEASSLEEASNLLFQATRLQKDYVAAIALSAQVKLMQADLKMEQLYWLEKSGQQPEQQTKLRLAANHLSEEGFNAAKRALELSPNNRVALRVMIDYYRHKKALTQAQPIIDQARNFPNEYLSITLGMAYIEDAETMAQGVELLKSGLERLPNYNHGRYFLAKFYYEQNKKEEGKLETAKILELSPNHELALKLKSEFDRPAPAASPAKGARQAAPAAPATMTTAQMLSKAKLLQGNDRTKEAVVLFEKVLEDDSSNIQALLGLGWCYIDLGYTDPAISSFKQVLGININTAEAYYGLGQAYKAKKNKAEAINNLQTFIKLAPNHSEAPFAKRTLEQLQQ